MNFEGSPFDGFTLAGDWTESGLTLDDLIERGKAKRLALGIRDRCLDFHWKVPRAAIERCGWTPSGDADYDAAVRSICAALVIAWTDGKWVSYSRTKSFYKSSTRYQGLPYSYARVTRAVEELTALGLVEEERATSHDRHCKQSRIRATQALIDAFEGVTLEYELRECVIRRDADGKLEDYPEHPVSRESRRRVKAINRRLKETVIDLPEEGIVRTGMHLKIDTKRGTQTIRMTPYPQLVRIFSRSSWGCGGRLYFWVQSLPQRFRKGIRIDGEETVEIDYASIHPRMLYAMVGAEMPDDPYSPKRKHGHGFGPDDRDLRKLALLVAINARTTREAIGYLVNHSFSKGPRDGEAWPLSWTETRDLIRALIAHNRPIGGYICSDVGIRLQREDSEIALAVMERCADAGFTALPVHDSFIVKARHADELRTIMDEEWTRWSDAKRPLLKASGLTFSRPELRRRMKRLSPISRVVTTYIW